MDQVIAVCRAHVFPVSCGAGLLDRVPRACLKSSVVLHIIEVAEPESPVIKQDSGSGTAPAR